ncbi:MAG: outer membrane lipoprotein-sorting protein [Opitutae bacterium]|nr:outer membrane lipoprotein-sorting protein [Opitutae bacterium]
MLALAPALCAAEAGARPAPVYADGRKPDQAEGARILGDFRQAGIVGDHWLAFDLQVLPRKGAGRAIAGEMLGTRGPGGPLTRLSLGAGRWLIQSGAAPAAWTVAEGAVRPASTAETMQPIAGTDFTLFDLQMPFLHWADFVYEGLAKVRSRPAHRFLLYPPADFAAARPEMSGVRVSIDTQFQAVVQVEQLGRDGRPAKSVTLLDLKKTGEQWLVKSVDLRNLVTRDKTRLTFKAAALDLALPPETFAPERLALATPPVDRQKIRGL